MRKDRLPTIHYLPKNTLIMHTYNTLSTKTYVQYANYNKLNYCIHVILKSDTLPTTNYLQYNSYKKS